MTFHNVIDNPALLEGLDAMGFKTPSQIQQMTIPLILQGHDVIACAQTGTGKTAAYLLPIIHRIPERSNSHQVNALILSPTRELAQQIDRQIEGLAYFTNISSISIYGGGDGTAWDKQKKALEHGADIIVATPGRLIALLANGKIDFTNLHYLVLDEADRMLDMGFFDDLVKIIYYLPTQRQTLLFSATMPPKIRQLAGRILHRPKEINLAIAKPPSKIIQQVYFVSNEQKWRLLQYILQTTKWASVIIFASKKETVKNLNKKFQPSQFTAHAFHSDIRQDERERLLREFYNKQIPILIGTDVLSRGIDIENISLIINWDIAPDAEDYVHRIGRTARADQTGRAITFVNNSDRRGFSNIEKLIKQTIVPTQLPDFLVDKKPKYGPPRRKKKHLY